MRRGSVCVFCGSSPGHDPAYAEAARRLGGAIAGRGLTLVYGAGDVGLMGVVADAALAAGGRVVGYIPRSLVDREVAHRGLTELHVVETMHQRKALMADRSDAFVALPGGFGTLDELFEILTWAQLGIHAKPVGLADVGGFFGPLLGWLDRAVADGFLRARHRGLLHVRADAVELLDAVLSAPPAAAVEKWAGPSER
ncbi:MAG: TIGR00730 family Rossman fold protein [Gemmataceae bacterium]